MYICLVEAADMCFLKHFAMMIQSVDIRTGIIAGGILQVEGQRQNL